MRSTFIIFRSFFTRFSRLVATELCGIGVPVILAGMVGLCRGQTTPVQLNWDPGTDAAGTVFVEQTTAVQTDVVFRIRSQNPASGAWRTVVRLTAGNADLYFRRGLVPDPTTSSGSDYRSTRATGDEGIVLNPSGQINVGEDYYILVRSFAGASWRLFSGEIYVEDLGNLTFADANGDGKFDAGETVTPQATAPRTVGGEGVVFYRATVPDGVPAWSLWLSNGLTNKVAVRKNFVPFQTAAPPVFEIEKARRILLVPDYLQASTAGSAYFISVAGNPGTEVQLDSRIHTFTDVNYESTTSITGTGPGYHTVRVSVPPNQPAWSISVTPQTGDPHLCLRRDKVGSEDDNNAYSEVASTTTADSITLSPSTTGMLQDGLTDGTFFLTVYSTSPNGYTATLRSGPVEVTDIDFESTTVNDTPERAGWRFYRVSDIESQNGLGWELQLTNQAQNTEIAIRRNAVPSRWTFRVNGVVQQTSGILSMASNSGLLQSPRHQRDVWYVGIYQPTLPLGVFTLDSRPMTATTLGFANTNLPITSLTAGRSHYWKVTVPADPKGWRLDILHLLPVVPAADGDCYFAVARDVLPSLLDTELNLPANVGPTDNSWASSKQMRIDRSRDLVPGDKDGDLSRRYSVVLPMGNPLEPGTYFLGIRPKTVDIKLDLLSRGIGEGAGWGIPIGNMTVTGDGAMPPMPPLALGEAAFFKTTVPPGMHAWELTLDTVAGDSFLTVQRGLIPGTSAADINVILRPNTSPTTIPGALLTRRIGAERLVMMESNGQTQLPPGDYYVAAFSQGVPAASGQPMTPVSAVLRSEGELAVQSAGTYNGTPLTVPFTLAAGQIAAWEFTLPAGLTAAEVAVTSETGNAVAAWWTGPTPRYPMPGKDSDRYGFEGGEPDAAGTNGAKLRVTSTTKQVLTHPNPAAGVYRLLLRAAIKTGTTFEPASGTFTIRGLAIEDLTFDGGTAAVTGQAEESWRFFNVEVPATPSLMGWDIRVENVVATAGTATTPDVMIRRDIPPPGGTQLGTTSIDWRTGEYWLVKTDWVGTEANPDNSRNAGAVIPIGRPLKPGRYVVGIKARSASINYTVRSRGIGDSFVIPVTPLVAAPSPGNSITVNALPFREAAFFKIDLTSPAPANLLVLADALTGTQDFRMVLRRGALPGVGAIAAVGLAADHGVLSAKSETGTTPMEEELYLALPSSGQSTLPAGIYYVAIVSEGNAGASGAATNTVDVKVSAISPVPVENLGLIPGDSNTEVTRNYDLRAGAVVVYEAEVMPNLTGRSAGIASLTGTSGLASNNGVTDRIPKPVVTGTPYGMEGGDQTGGYLATVVGSGLCQDIPPGKSRFVVRAVSGPSGWTSATGRFSIGPCSAFPVIPCDGGEIAGVLAPSNWTHFKIVVPDAAKGWDLRCVSSKQLDMVIRRSVPADSVNASVLYSSTSWPAQGTYVVSGDWTGLTQNSESKYFLWGVLPMGQPLEPGTYYIGIRNGGTVASDWAVKSQAIGNEFSIPIEPLDFTGPSSQSTSLPLQPKTARYFKVSVPSGMRTWEFDSQVTNGDVLLAIRKDRIPGSKADVNQGPYATHGLTLDKPGNERMVMLPQDGQEYLEAGDYFVALVSKGTGAAGVRSGATAAEALMHNIGAVPLQSLGVVSEQHPVSLPLTFAEAQIKTFEFEITTATPGVEVRLDERAGLPRLALWTGDARLLPEPPLSTPKYGFWGGSKTGGTNVRYEQDAIYTMANVAPGRYRLVLRACPSGSTYPAAACRLSISVKPHIPLAFGPLLETGGLSSRHQAQLVKGQKNLYSVNVPSTYNGKDVLGWLVYVRQLSGTTGLRAFRLSGTNPEIAVTGQNSLLMAPPWFTPGQTWYLSVDGEGLAEYEVESRPVQLEQSPWVLPSSYSVTFGDSAVSPQQLERPLSQDDWHFYAITVPDNNAGVMRTMLESISGNPDLYVRAGAIPTSDHKHTGSSGNDLFDRRLNGTTTEYGNWVPEKGRSETQLAPATWYLGVRASSARNASYRLRASSAAVMPLDQTNGSVSDETLAGGDWRYYLFTAPETPPAAWKLNFNRTQGNAVLYIRDTIPPGDFALAGSVKYDNTDAKNSGPYKSGGYSQPGIINYTNPVLRPGHRYWVGVRAMSDAQYSLSSTTEGSLANIPVLSFTNGTFNEPLAPGESRLFRVPVPRGSTRLSANLNGAGGTLELRVEQGSPPAPTGSAHGAVSASAFAQNLGTNAETQWPWLSGYDYYFRLTNTGTTERSPFLVMTGLAPISPDTDNDGLLDSWERNFFANSLTPGALDDPDKDGLVNLLEFGLGTSPVNPARTTQPLTVRLDSAGRLVMELTKPSGTDISVIQYSVEFSSDLTTWSAAAGVVVKDNAAVLEVRDSVATTTAAHRHVRLRVRRAGTQ